VNSHRRGGRIGFHGMKSTVSRLPSVSGASFGHPRHRPLGVMLAAEDAAISPQARGFFSMCKKRGHWICGASCGSIEGFQLWKGRVKWTYSSGSCVLFAAVAADPTTTSRTNPVISFRFLCVSRRRGAEPGQAAIRC
jgi:hypothetical protein